MPTNKKIRCEYDQLATLANQFEQEADQTLQMFQQIQNMVENLQGGGWIGVGADRFYAEMEDLLFPALKRLVQALEDTGNCVSRVSSLFSEAEQEASGQFLVSASAWVTPSSQSWATGLKPSPGALESNLSGSATATPAAPNIIAGASATAVPAGPDHIVGNGVNLTPSTTPNNAFGSNVSATPLPIPEPPQK